MARRKKSLLRMAMEAERRLQDNTKTREEFVVGCRSAKQNDAVTAQDMLNSLGEIEKFAGESVHKTIVDLIAEVNKKEEEEEDKASENSASRMDEYGLHASDVRPPDKQVYRS